MNRSETEVKAALRRWVTERASRVPAEGVHDDTPLLASRLISSLHVMDMLLLIEEISGKRVQPEQISPGAFANINDIYGTFFREA